MKKVTFQNITFGYNKLKPVLNNLSFQFKNSNSEKGHVIALMGASGSGKSTILRLILGNLKPQKGTVNTSPENPIISYLPQEPVLFEHLSPMQNACYFKNISAYKNFFDNDLFEKLSYALGMNYVFKNSKSINELSGGEKQRLALLRALSIKPDVLLLDEPTSGLDSDVKLQFLHQLRSIIIEQNVLTIYVTHHKIETELIVDEIAYLPNPDGKGIQKIFHSDLLSFTEIPPVLDAVSVFNYPKPNIVKYKIGENMFIPTSDFSESFFTNIQEENIFFSESIGLTYSVISANPIFTLLEISNGQYLTLDSRKIPNHKSKIYFSGKLAKYNKEFLFQSFFYLEENKII